VPPSFCRHNRFLQNCPICRAPEPAPGATTRPARSSSSRARSASAGASRAARSGSVRVRQLSQAPDDGYRSELVPGLKATADAERLAGELAFASARLEEFADDPPGMYAEIVTMDDPEEALWLAFLVALICPTQDGEEPFAAIRQAHVPWVSGELPRLDVARGPRSQVSDPATGEKTVLAYRAWAARAGGQQAAFAVEPAWTPQRRFDRVFERLSLPGFGRGGRYELLVSLGRLDVVEAQPTALRFGDDATTLAAKRVFGIGDTVLLERRAKALADAVELPIEALDLALYNWGARARGGRAAYGSQAVVDDGERDAIAAVLGV
jgi:Alpha-glutamyl/putrescinyl thymine pyrophosphorylase clade 3